MTPITSILLPFVFLAATAIGGGWLGVTLGDSDTPTISQVFPDSPAAKAGLKHGDVIVSLNGKKVRSVDSMIERFEGFDPGDTIRLVIRRDGKNWEKKIRLAKRPVEGRKPTKAKAKKEVRGERRDKVRKPAPKPSRETTRQDAPKSKQPAFLGVRFTNVEKGSGIKVLDVIEGAPAVKGGVRRGDLLLSINGRKIENMEAFRKVMGTYHAKDRLRLRVVRGKAHATIEITAGSWPKDLAREVAKPAPKSAPREVIEERPAKARLPVVTEKKSTGYSNSLERALKTARAKGRPTMVVFGASWCVNCETLKKSLAHESLNKVLNAYERVWVDTDKQSKLADEFDVERLPHIVLFDRRGKVQKKITGYQPPQVLLTALSGLVGKPDRVAIVDVAEPTRRRATKDRAQESQINRMRREIDQLRAAQRRLETQLRRLQAELRRKK